MRWQAREKEELYIPKLDKKYDFVHTINDVNITQYGEIGCLYSFDDGDGFILCYVPKETMRLLDALENDKVYLNKTERFVDGIRDCMNEEKIELLGHYKFLVTSNPERWGIVLRYQIMNRT